MNLYGLIILGVLSVGLLLLPHRYSHVPLVISATWATNAQGIDIGVFYFSLLRIIALLTVVRALASGNALPGGLNKIDFSVIASAFWLVVVSPFHTSFSETLTFHLGQAYNILFCYFAFRTVLSKQSSLKTLPIVLPLALFPVALEMLFEQHFQRNLFAFMGGVPDTPNVRMGNVRSQGPFAHSILAGTVGATLLPFALLAWQKSRLLCVVATATALTMVFTSHSSGPLMTAIFSAVAVGFWSWRAHLRSVRRWAVVGYCVLELVMKAPAYYLIAKIDLAGGSTSYFRARLIEMAISHFSEWWLAGTDYTRHWMATGVGWSESHTDIVNHYVQLGVWAGFLMVVLFLSTIALAFRSVGGVLQNERHGDASIKFLPYAYGASLFAHCVAMISVSYFDQSIVFLYMIIAACASLRPASSSAVGVEYGDESPSQTNVLFHSVPRGSLNNRSGERNDRNKYGRSILATQSLLA